ncbi:hypothetical protein BgiBS90_013657 [Biomphalaria glabrata]|nr:hypothetical protein BgiBS90_013657 [Biomphalaria glabrata]
MNCLYLTFFLFLDLNLDLKTEAFQANSNITISQFGMLFYIVPPEIHWTSRYDTSVFVYLSTISKESIQVLFTTPNYKPTNEGAYTKIKISYYRLETLYIPKQFLLNNNTAKHKVCHCLKFQGRMRFGLSILLMVAQTQLDMYQVLPASFWGRSYLILTLGPEFYLHIISIDAQNKVQIYFQGHGPYDWSSLSNNVNTIIYSENVAFLEWIVQEIEQVLVLSTCSVASKSTIHFTGTKVISELPVGVISGECFAQITSVECSNTSNTDKENDVTQEMMFPTTTFGRHYLLFFSQGSTPYVEVAVQAVSNDTRLMVYTNDSNNKVEEYTIDKAEGVIYISLIQFPRVLQSSKPVQVFYVQRHPCDLNMTGIALVIVVPTALFYNKYTWGMVSFAPTQYYLLIVVREQEWKQLTFNDYNLDDYFQNTEPIAFWGSRNWVQLEFHLDMESKSIRCTRDTFFGCYVYRVGQQVSFSQSLGFLKGYTCVNTSMEPGDQIDNDCDFEKDEEIANGLDDDYDNLIDEDLEATYIEAPFEDIILQEIEENPKEQGEFTLRTAYDTFLWITTSAIVLTMLAGMLRLKRSHMAGGQ